MIFFLRTHDNDHPLRKYLESHGAGVADRFVPVTYEELVATREYRTGVYCFADLELLSTLEREAAARTWDELTARGLRTLNHPLRSRRRYDLLRALHRHGANRFNVYRVDEVDPPLRFPVFVRGENDHKGALTPLLHTPGELTAAIDAMHHDGAGVEDKLIVEFCDTADDAGMYRKYSAFIVGDRVLARHVFFDRDWMVKRPRMLNSQLLEEERRYVETNPHESQLSAIFAEAEITYGRIDYGMLDGTIQVWEINTNPMIVGGTRRVAHVDPDASPSWTRLRAAARYLRRPVTRQLGKIERVAALRRDPPRPRAAVNALFATRLQAAWEALDR